MSSKASKLGAGASFANTRTVSARRQAIEAATKAPTEATAPPVKLPVTVISLNPANPRSELGDLTDLAGSLRDHGQKQAITVMSRFAYLEANPGREEDLEKDTRFVAIDGNSRLAAAREAGLQEIKVTLDEELGSDPDEILESALVANIHRQDLSPLDEAHALKQLLVVHGSQRKLAARLHRSQGWVSQRLALLSLTPELKEKLVKGEEPAELLRSVGNKKPGEQLQHLAQLKAKREIQPSTDSGSGTVKAHTRAGESDYGVITPRTVTPARRSVEDVKAPEPAGNEPSHAKVMATDAGSRTEGEDTRPATGKPSRGLGLSAVTEDASVRWDDPEDVFRRLVKHMPLAGRKALAVLLIDSHTKE